LRKPKKYMPTPAIDAAITRIYQEEADKRRRTLPTLRAFAQKIRWPDWAVKRRGLELGLARTKESLWSDAELEILENYTWMSDERIALKLRRAGFTRSAVAVHLKLKRMRYKESSDYYSAQGLASALGVDVHPVLRWIRFGYLKAKRRGTARVEVQGGDTWLILERDVRRFIIEHPEEIDLRKVDGRWFLFVITNGQVAA